MFDRVLNTHVSGRCWKNDCNYTKQDDLFKTVSVFVTGTTCY